MGLHFSSLESGADYSKQTLFPCTYGHLFEDRLEKMWIESFKWFKKQI